MSINCSFIISGIPSSKINAANAQLKLFKNKLRLTKKETNHAIYKESKNQNFISFHPQKLNEALYQEKVEKPHIFFTYIYTKQPKYIFLFQQLKNNHSLSEIPSFYGKAVFTDESIDVSKEYLMRFFQQLVFQYQCTIHIEISNNNKVSTYQVDKNGIHQSSNSMNLHNSIEYHI